MSRCISMSFICLIIIASTPALAEDSNRQKEITEGLSWLPAGEFTSIGYCDFWVSAKESEGWDLLQEYFGKTIRDRLGELPLPSSMTLESTGFIRAYLSHFVIVDKKHQEEKDARKKRTGELIVAPIRVSFQNQEGKSIRQDIDNVADECWIFQYGDVNQSVAKALKQGELSTTPIITFGEPIFSFMAGAGGEYYGYITFTGRFLVSNKIEVLKDMIMAGSGQGESLIDSEAFNDFAEIIPELGQMWQIADPSLRYRVQLEVANKLDASRDYIEGIEKRLLLAPRMFVSNMVFGDNIINQEMWIYSTGKQAQKVYMLKLEELNKQRRRVSHDKSGTLDFAREHLKNTKIRIEGETVTVTTIENRVYLREEARHGRNKRNNKRK